MIDQTGVLPSYSAIDHRTCYVGSAIDENGLFALVFRFLGNESERVFPSKGIELFIIDQPERFFHEIGPKSLVSTANLLKLGIGY